MAFNSSDLAYIYGLRDKSSDKYFYVGSTKHTPQHRWRSHQGQLKCGHHRNESFVRAVQRIGSDNVVCEPLQIVTVTDRWVAERDWVERFIGENHPLVNRVMVDLNYRSATDYRNYVLTPMRLRKFYEMVGKPAPRARKPEWQGIVDGLHCFLIEVAKSIEKNNLESLILGQQECPVNVRF